MNERLLEPLEYYEKEGEKTHEQNAVARFEELLSASKVNVEENKATVRAYRAEMENVTKLSKSLSAKKGWRGFLIFTMVVGVVATVLGLFLFTQIGEKAAFICGGGILLFTVSLLVVLIKLNPAIKKTKEILASYQQRAQELLTKAEKQVAPLNALFKENETRRLIEKTLPEFAFDEFFSAKSHALFTKHYDLVKQVDENSSTTDTLSGRFEGNPFLYCDNLVHRLGTQTYYGTRVITWTERYRDANGKTSTRIRSQTLHASVTKPKPFYHQKKKLYYGCQAAPDLKFNREPKHSERLSENEIERKVKKGAKKLRDKTEKAIQKGGRFQAMTNEEFDVLFGATNRTHEVQFRLMYTPLAQCNTVDLLTSKTGYGDDFYFAKAKRCNCITSEHAQHWAMRSDPSYYYSYDVEEIRQRFVSFNKEYFKSVFFDFAPLFAVPAYMEEPSVELEDMKDCISSFPEREHEVMANRLGGQILAHTQTNTQSIFKTSFVGKGVVGDVVDVTAYSYSAEDRIEYVSVYGGDGHFHGVPVHWVEYVPLRRKSRIIVATEREKDTQKPYPNQVAVFHGLSAWRIG